MNNLKFRAWHKELKEMEPVLLMCLVNEYVNVLPARNLEGGSQEQWNFKGVILMQSTGLKDSNGVEIFEGDIVKWLMEDEPYQIVYDSKRLLWTGQGIWSEYEDYLNDLNLNPEVFEIIGNIYEQPELLEVENEKI